LGLTGLEEFKEIKTACLVALGTMRRFNLHVGQQLELRGTVYPFNVTLTIVGTIAKGPVPSFLIFRRDYFEEAAGKPGIAHEFWVRVDDSRFVPEVAAAVDNQFANSAAETRSASEAAAVGSILGRYRIFMNLAEFLGLVAVVAIGLVAANTAAMSIRERRSEIAVMRSIGFRPGMILSLLVGESLIIALSGGAIGCGVAFGLFKVFALNADALGPFVSLHVPPSVLAETLGVAALIGLFSAYVPARGPRNAASLRPSGLWTNHMAIPFKYNRRSLLIRRVSNSMTVGAIAIVVGVFVAAMAIVGGLDSAIKDSSSPDNMILIGRGADSEANSFITLDQLDALKFLPAIKRDGVGHPLVSPELAEQVFMPPATPWTTFPFAECCP